MRQFFVAAAAFLSLSGCSSTPSDLEAKATPSIQTYPQSYQEIYRNVSSTAKRCFAGNISVYASIAVDSELYPDLGYGEVSISMINVGARNYYASARIDKLPKGSRMTARAGNTLGADSYVEKLTRWANGDQTC